MSDLFLKDVAPEALKRPLADRIRPQELSEVVGQEKLVGANGSLIKLLNSGRIPSIIFWGPPGTGKTTLARIVAKQTDMYLEQLSAIQSGVADLKKIFAAAKMRHQEGKSTLLFVDEIHRFNRSQQDMFLPYIEDGTIILFGATTENPSFDLNAALLSRCQVMVLDRLENAELEQLVMRAEELEEIALNIEDGALDMLLNMADGDGRSLLNMLEQLFAVNHVDKPIDAETLQLLLQKRAANYDKNKDGHYNLISALHKSVRGSDVDGALYWFGRMLDAGESPRFLARRIVRMASEEVGMADPQALVQCMAARDAYEFLGSPEGELALAQALIYVTTAPKSNAVTVAYNQARSFVKQHGNYMPPKHILNAPTQLMKDQGYKDGYQYDHDCPDAFSGQEYFPDEVERAQFYQPVERGFERDIAKRLNWWHKLRKERNS
ncbi:MAG: replication-associated recombination protein A [Rhizobiales bacterium]|nr:replication-associated recombination protein A [Hyphomicrobiales bacterium]NRB13681.1 replication-associated recombination protein A [Hyphomicrobiales bacterium]